MFLTEGQARVYDKVVYELYACDDGRQFPHLAMAAVQALVPFDSGVFFPVAAENLMLMPPLSQDLNEGLYLLYERYYHEHDLYRKIVFSQNPIPLVDRCSDYFDLNIWEKTNAHRAEFLLPNGMYHLAGVQLFRKGKLTAIISIHRNRIREDFDDCEMAVLKALAQHINCAYQRLCELEELRQEINFLTGRCGLSLKILTEREKEIVRLLAEGYTNKQIAGRLRISQETVKCHIKKAFDKTGAKTRTELISRIYLSGSGRNG